MKTLKDYILTEKLKLNAKSKVEDKYQPKDKKELRTLLEELLQERGKDANLNDIYTSAITDMSELFKDLDPHNIDISGWDVSNVENMEKMFTWCINFNSDLSKWDVSKVENMAFMFNFCTEFDCDLSKWNVSNVKDINKMFFGCEHFNCDMSKWNVSKVTNMEQSFIGCDSLINKPSWYKR